jgi:hypothetical protein
MSKTQFTQCKLARQDENSRTETTSWIPTKVKDRDNGGLVKLRVGMIVDLKEPGDEDKWTRDWQVMSMGLPTEAPPDVHKLIKGHRKMTGDSQPRRNKG